MTSIRAAQKLTHAGALVALNAAIEQASAMGVPQCIVVADEGANLVACVRMDGARVLSMDSATRKAMTAATTGQPTGGMPFERAMMLAEATGGRVTNLPGGLPLLVDGQSVGGVGVGSGTGDQDLEVAKAAVIAFEASLKAPA